VSAATKTIKGWKKISNERGFVNEITGQTLIIAKKAFGQTYHASIFEGEQTQENDCKRVSPEFASMEKAEAFAVGWMEKHPNGL
jgi:hypothetical protein